LNVSHHANTKIGHEDVKIVWPSHEDTSTKLIQSFNRYAKQIPETHLKKSMIDNQIPANDQSLVIPPFTKQSP